MSPDRGEVRWNAATQKWERVRGSDAASPPPVRPPAPEMPPPPPPPPAPHQPEAAPASPLPPTPPGSGPDEAYPVAGPDGAPSWDGSYPAPVEPSGVRPRRRVPVAVVVAMVVVAAAGAGGGWFLARGGPEHPKAVASSPGPGSPSVTPDRSDDGKAGPSASPSAGATVPAGFRLTRDPRGFTLNVPQGWTRQDQGAKGVFYNSADGARLIQVYPVAEAGLSPYDALKQTSGELAKNPGYQEISLGNDATVPGGATQAARLVYAYDNQQLGHRRQVVDYAFLTPGGEHYAVLSAAPATAWPEQENTLKTVLSAFCAGSNCPSVPAS